MQASRGFNWTGKNTSQKSSFFPSLDEPSGQVSLNHARWALDGKHNGPILSIPIDSNETAEGCWD